jgi:DNA helicase-2/ATP-dependent DNA helicase PcrA
MTLHTAKGLEYRTVVITGLEEGLLPHSRSKDSTEETEEERRLLFVGMTRAKEDLHLTNSLQRYRWGQHSFSIRSRFLEEIDEGAIEDGHQPFSVSEKKGRHYEVDDYVDAPAEEEDPLVVGMQVRHSHFGVGRVVDLSGSGPSTRITVDFASYGRKKLVKMYAKLVPVGDLPW